MGKIEFILPAMGEGIIEATITRWFVKEGDKIEVDDPMLEVATDKVDSEIPSPVTGVVSRIIYHEGEIPKIGEVLALIDDGKGKDQTLQDEKPQSKAASSEDVDNQEKVRQRGNRPRKPKQESRQQDDRKLTPFIIFLARDRGISLDELIQIPGSGKAGALTRDDLNNYIKDGRQFREAGQIPEKTPEKKNAQSAAREEEVISAGPGEEIIEMSRTRRLIAEHMVRSKRTSPHVTSMVELDVTNVVQWRESNKEIFGKKFGIKLTYTPLIIEAAVKALKLFPDVNISVKGNYIIRKKYINIGIATALPDGDLIVPVIKEADNRNFVNLALELNDLAGRARENKLQPAEIKGGTFTITNMGQYDNVSGTPIINQPEAAILAVGAIKKKPAVVDIDGEQTIGIRDILILSLTYDHRVIDGALGGSFVRSIGEKMVSELPDF